jgi:N6-L-threonylcarbamoyladenine synthase
MRLIRYRAGLLGSTRISSTQPIWSRTPRRDLTVLALESSADDSCAAIVNSDRQILSNVVVKQHHLNVKHGGIHPLEAQHAHERNVVRCSGCED